MTYLRRSRNPFAAPKPPKKSRIGKTGTVRLIGPDMTELRKQAYLRANGFCEECGIYTPWKSGELAHIKAKRRNGDSLDNVRWLCPSDHRKEHAWGVSKEKPCPTK
jgi:hypothetical protein